MFYPIKKLIWGDMYTRRAELTYYISTNHPPFRETHSNYVLCFFLQTTQGWLQTQRPQVCVHGSISLEGEIYIFFQLEGGVAHSRTHCTQCHTHTHMHIAHTHTLTLSSQLKQLTLHNNNNIEVTLQEALQRGNVGIQIIMPHTSD